MAGAVQPSLAYAHGNVSFLITTDHIEVAEGLRKVGGYVAAGPGVTTFGTLLGNRLFKPIIEDVVNVVIGHNRNDQGNPITEPGSQHVLLHCLTDERFIDILEDYEAGEIKERLQEELSLVGFRAEGLKVEIENVDKINKTKAAINKSASSEIIKSSSYLTEEMAESEATKTKKTDLHFTFERKLPTTNNQDFRIDISEEHSNWLSVGKLLHLIRKPISVYVDEIVKAFHGKLRKDLLSVGKCSSPKQCYLRIRPNHLCESCISWYNELAASHEQDVPMDSSRLSNCNSARWSEDHWEVAKYFMSSPAPILGNVKDAESTDLKDLLSALNWMKDKAFLGKTRISAQLVKDLLRMRNEWVCQPERQFTRSEKNQSFILAIRFLRNLKKVYVFPHEENRECLEFLQRLRKSRFIIVTME